MEQERAKKLTASLYEGSGKKKSKPKGMNLQERKKWNKKVKKKLIFKDEAQKKKDKII